MKVLVTGGAGFIGSNVIDGLLGKGYDVVVIDDLSTGFKENLNPKAVFYKVALCDEAGVRKIFEKERPDFVNHHAAQMDVRRSVREPVFDARVNILGSLNLIENSVRSGIKKFIYVSTGGAVYGEADILPAQELSPVRPICPYGVSKHTVEHYLYLYAHNAGLKYTVLRYANVYGPRQNPYGEAGVVAIFTEKLLSGERPTIFGDGSQGRDYIYVGDVVEANVLALDKGDNEIYNIGTGRQTTVVELFDSLKAALGSSVEPVFGPPRGGEIGHIFLDSQKAFRDLGWSASYTLEEGFRETIKYYREASR